MEAYSCDPRISRRQEADGAKVQLCLKKKAFDKEKTKIGLKQAKRI
jgi:hypothetical protein